MKQNFKRKLMAGLLSACMMFQMVGTVPAYAVENVADSNAQEIPKENIVEAKTANTVTLDIKDGAIRISPTGYERYDGSKWTTTAYTGSYVITGTNSTDLNVTTAITVSGLADKATLTLKNLTIGSTSNQTALSLTGDQTVCIDGTVKLGGLQTAIKANGALNFTGSGSLALSVSNNNNQGPATAVISAASVAATLDGDITVTATANNGAGIHAIKTTGKVVQFGEVDSTTETTVDGKVSLTSTGGKVKLISSRTTAPLIMSAGAVTISGYGDVSVTNATGEIAILAGSGAVSLTSEIGKVDVTGNGNSPAIQAGTVTISGYRDVSVESTGGPAIIAGGGAVSLTSTDGWVKVTGKGNGPAIQASAVTISGKTDVVVTNATGPAISASNGEVSLTSKSRVVEVSSEGTAISSGKLTIHSNGSVLVSSTGSGPAIGASGEVSLTSDNSNVEVNGNTGASTIQASTLTITAKTDVVVTNATGSAISATGAISLNANDIYIGGLISASNSVTFTAPKGAMVISENEGKLITGTVTVATNTKLKLIGNTTGITYANDGSKDRTTACTGDVTGGGTVNAAGTYIAGNGTIEVTQSDDGMYTATMTNATVDADLSFNDNCTITLVGKNQFDNQLSLLNNSGYLTLTINGTGELIAPNIEADNITITDGTVNAVNISSNYDKGTLSITGGTVNTAQIVATNELKITGGTVNAETIAAKTPSITGTAKVNAIVQNITIGEKSVTVYGNVTLTQDLRDLPGTSTFTVPVGRSLTVPSGVKLYLIYCTGDGETAGTKAITNSGTMTINGELMLPTAFKGEGAIKGMKLTGNGSVKVSNGEEQPGTTYTTYFTDGSQPHNSTTPLNFSEVSADAGNLTDDGYEWKKDTKTLTLKNLWLEVSDDGNAITLPDAAKLVLQGTSTVIAKNSAIEVNGNLTVSGTDGILKVGGTDNVNGRSIEATGTGTLTVDSGTILSAGNNASMYANAIEIKAGTIDLGARGMMMVITTLTISGGNVTTGDNKDSMCAKDIVISGGMVKTGASSHGSISAMSSNSGTVKTSINITGGTVIANGGNHPSTPIGILAMNGDISITGGTVTATGGIDSGSGVIVGGGIAAIGGTITTTGMTATTTPVGGTVKTGTVPTQDIPMEVTSYTAEATLQAEGGFGMITNACTTVSLAKTQTPPVIPPDSGNTGGSGSTGSGDSSGTTAPPTEPVVTAPPAGSTNTATEVKYDDVKTSAPEVSGETTVAVAEITLDETVAAAATATAPIEIKATLSATDASSTINSATTKAVDFAFTVSDSIASNPHVYIQELKVSSDILQAAATAGKDLTFAVNSASGTALFSMSFKASELAGKNLTDVNLAMNMVKPSTAIAKTLPQSTVLSFQNNGAFPAPCTVTANVADTYKDGTVLNLYYDNVKKGTLELVKQGLTVAFGEVVATIGHASDYVLSTALINTTSKPSTNPATGVASTGVKLLGQLF